MKKLYVLILFCCLLAPCSAGATELYASQTGKACSYCHIDPGGGGELTAAGKTFAASLQEQTKGGNVILFNKAVRFFAGYIHFLTAILWFGTILYVHLVLKPAYASGGLPRGEVRVGVISMVVMGVTGAILTHYRVQSPDVLLHTRFGVLLMVKVGIYLLMVLSAAFVVTVLGPKLKAKVKGPANLPAGGEVTAEDLAGCDGKEGRPAWFGFEGKVYDASTSRLWREGRHMGRHQAGADLTEALRLAPHGEDKVLALKEVGKLVAVGKPPLHARVFYTMAYLNLGAVFLIVLILALWRWS